MTLLVTVLVLPVGYLTAHVRAQEEIGAEDSVPQRWEKAPMAAIIMDARCYGDSIVLRWAAEDWAVQQALYQVGVDIIRFDDTGGIDTLVTELRPWTKEQFIRSYSAKDSLANMAIGLLYGGREMRPDQTRSAQGSMGSWLELSENQKQHLMFTMLVAEWRKDLADHVAMRWVDKDVEEGRKYEYAVMPSYFDESGTLQIGSASKRLTNEKYVPPKFDIEIGDSITEPYRMVLWWEDRGYSSYEIDRRMKGETEWKRLTDIPYLNMTPVNRVEGKMDCQYYDYVGDVGTYEYRIFGHDPYGELTEASPIHTVVMPDIEAPKAPEVIFVEIDRQDPYDLSKQVMATFHFRKDSLEDDFVGFMPMYYNERNTKREWKELSPDLLSPTDSLFTCDMTGLSTGMVVVAAYDTAHNVSYSIPRMVSIKDVKAPSMMRNFKADASLEDGTITLSWEPDSVDDDIEYYDVLVANDTTHTFIQATKGKHKECMFVDTVALDVNQKYIYYKVRAIDYSTNIGELTPWLQVVRPTRLKPMPPHLLRSEVDSSGIHMQWSCSNEQIMDHHVLLRRTDGEERWDTLGIYDADSIKAADDILRVTDTPAYNRHKDYQYAMESFSCWSVGSGLSLVVSIAYEGSRFVDIPIVLSGHYDMEKEEMVFLIDIKDRNHPMEGGEGTDDCYICIYHQNQDMRKSMFLISQPITRREIRLPRSAPGAFETVYVKLRFKDGRESHDSNSVTVTVPASNTNPQTYD